MNNQENALVAQFEKFADEELNKAKTKLSYVPHTGTISNYSERLNIFNENLKHLNDIFISNINSMLDKNNSSPDNTKLKESLFGISKRRIEDFITFFKN